MTDTGGARPVAADITHRPTIRNPTERWVRPSDIRRVTLREPVLLVLACNLADFMRTLASPDAVEPWTLTTLRKKLVKIGAKIVRHGRDVTFRLAEVAVPRELFADILRRIDRRRPKTTPT